MTVIANPIRAMLLATTRRRCVRRSLPDDITSTAAPRTQQTSTSATAALPRETSPRLNGSNHCAARAASITTAQKNEPSTKAAAGRATIALARRPSAAKTSPANHQPT